MNQLNKIDIEKLNLLSELASYQIDNILDDLNIDYKVCGKMYIGRCPIHDGNRPNAWNYYPDGYSVRGLWYCRSNNCHQIFQKTIPGLIRGIFSKEKGWKIGNPPKVGLYPVIDYLCEFLNQKWSDLKIDKILIDKKKFIKDIDYLGLYKNLNKDGWKLDDVKKN